MSQNVTAFTYMKKGLLLLKNPIIRTYALIPILINIIIAIGVIIGLHHSFSSLTSWLDNLLPSWLHWLDWLIWLLYSASLIFFFIYLFNIVANIIAAPFNGFLAEAVQRHYNIPIQNRQSTFKVMMSAIKRQMDILLYCIPLGLGGTILFFIPLINIFAPLIWFLLSAWMMTLQYSDYAFDNNHIYFKTMKKALGTRRSLSLSFGGFIVILSMIPLLNLIIIPTAVISATLIYLDNFHESI